MQITLIEPFYIGSHKTWVEELVRHSCHKLEVLSLPGRYWKWRMHGAAVTLAHRYLAGNYQTDLLLATDMVDLTTFLALTRKKTAPLPTALYFHENQLTYPWSPDDQDPGRQRDAHYGFINFTSALAADTVLFNSRYHLESFHAALPGFLKSFPDYKELRTLPRLRKKSRVLPIGLDLKAFDRYRPKMESKQNQPLILWNHRWEYDKNPGEFFRVLYQLEKEKIEFELAVLGESFGERSPVFAEAKRRLKNRIVQWGYVRDFPSYAEWLWRADILPIHSLHDFFGISVVEAMYCNCFPLLPKRLAYPEHIPQSSHDHFFYSDLDDLILRMKTLLRNNHQRQSPEVRSFVSRYDWEDMAPLYDKCFEEIAQKHPS